MIVPRLLLLLLVVVEEEEEELVSPLELVLPLVMVLLLVELLPAALVLAYQHHCPPEFSPDYLAG